MSMEIILLTSVFVAGAAVGTYATTKVLAFRTRKKRRAREAALNSIASHKWDTGDHNDAVVITRIALKGLAGKFEDAE